MRIVILREKTQTQDVCGGTIINNRNIELFKGISDDIVLLEYEKPSVANLWGRILRRFFFF